MLDLSTIIDDLLTEKAKLRTYLHNEITAAGAALDVNIFTCPPNVIRLMLYGQIVTSKTTGTALSISYFPREQTASPGQFLYGRTVGSSVLVFPINESAAKSDREFPIGLLHLFEYGDYIKVTHALTAGEIINHTYRIRYIEWQKK